MRIVWALPVYVAPHSFCRFRTVGRNDGEPWCCCLCALSVCPRAVSVSFCRCQSYILFFTAWENGHVAWELVKNCMSLTSVRESWQPWLVTYRNSRFYECRCSSLSCGPHWFLCIAGVRCKTRWDRGGTHVVRGHRLKVVSAARARDKPTSGSFRGLCLYS